MGSSSSFLTVSLELPQGVLRTPYFGHRHAGWAGRRPADSDPSLGIVVDCEAHPATACAFAWQAACPKRERDSSTEFASLPSFQALVPVANWQVLCHPCPESASPSWPTRSSTLSNRATTSASSSFFLLLATGHSFASRGPFWQVWRRPMTLGERCSRTEDESASSPCFGRQTRQTCEFADSELLRGCRANRSSR